MEGRPIKNTTAKEFDPARITVLGDSCVQRLESDLVIVGTQAKRQAGLIPVTGVRCSGNLGNSFRLSELTFTAALIKGNENLIVITTVLDMLDIYMDQAVRRDPSNNVLRARVEALIKDFDEMRKAIEYRNRNKCVIIWSLTKIINPAEVDQPHFDHASDNLRGERTASRIERGLRDHIHANQDQWNTIRNQKGHGNMVHRIIPHSSLDAWCRILLNQGVARDYWYLMNQLTSGLKTSQCGRRLTAIDIYREILGGANDLGGWMEVVPHQQQALALQTSGN